jgi:hypothetical protein
VSGGAELSRRARFALSCLGLFSLVLTGLVVYTFAAALH